MDKITKTRFKINKKFLKSHKTFIKSCKKRDDFNEYKILSLCRSSRKNIKIKHKCGNIFDMKANNFTSNKYTCPKCSGHQKYNFNELKELVINSTNGEYEILSGKNSNFNIIHHKCGNIFKSSYSSFFRSERPRRCPYCAGNKKFSFNDIKLKVSLLDEEFEVIDTIDNKNNFKNVHSTILFKHKKCGSIFPKEYNNFRNGQRCPYCTAKEQDSKAVNEIEKYLIENNIKYKKEETFDDLRNDKTGRLLRIDFYLIDFNLYIEYDGKQHYIYSEKGRFTKDKYEEIKYRDNLKNEYFKNKNLTLKRISYLEDHIKELEKIVGSTTIESASDKDESK